MGGCGQRPVQQRRQRRACGWWRPGQWRRQGRAGGQRSEQQRRRRVEEKQRRRQVEEQRDIDGLGWAFLPTLDPLVSNGPFLHSSHFMSHDLLFFSFVLSIYTCIIHRQGKRLATPRRD